MESKRLSVLQEQLLHTYYADDAKRLRKTVDRILSKFGGLSDKDRDDFYSLANEVFADIIKRYDSVQSFDGFLYSCLLNKVKTEMTKRNRKKRRADRLSVPMDAADEKCSLSEFIASDFDTFEEVFRIQGNRQYDDKVEQYISRLSGRQVNILNLLIDGYRPIEIWQILGISPKEYSDDLSIMRSYENIKILF